MERLDCSKTEDYLMKYMDNNLTSKEANELNRHISCCEKCKEEFMVYDQMMTEFMEMELDVAPEGFELRVMEKVKELEPISSNVENAVDGVFWFIWGFVSVVMGLGFMLTIYKDNVLSLLKANTDLGWLLDIFEPISTFVSGIANSVISNITSGLLSTTTFIESIRIVVLLVLVVMAFVLIHRGRKASNREKI